MYSLPFIGRELLPLRYIARYKPDILSQFSSCGTKFHGDVFYAGDVATRDASDRRSLRNPRVDRVDARTIDHDQNMCFKWRIITVVMKRQGAHLDHPIAI